MLKDVPSAFNGRVPGGPGRLRHLSAGDLILAAALMALWNYFAGLPLWPSDLWDHVNYGRCFLKTGALPETEPLLPLVRTTSVVFSAWASQLCYAVIDLPETVNLSLFQLSHATLVAGISAVACWWIRHRNGSTVAALLGGAAINVIGWQQFQIIRPQTAGVVCFCLCFVTTASAMRAVTKIHVALGIALFVIWANLHGSFVTGLCLVALMIAGHTIDLWFRVGSRVRHVWWRHGRSRILFFSMCVAATFINPYGWRLHMHTLEVATHPNMTSMIEWSPLSLEMKQGRATAITVAIVFALLFASRRRIFARDVLPVFFFLALSCWSARMLNWLAPLCGILTGLHAGSSLRTLTATSVARPLLLWLRRPSRWASALAAVIVAATVCTSSPGQRLLNIRPQVPHQQLADVTPIGVAEFLAKRDPRPQGIVFLPAEWAGYVQHEASWVGPFVNIHVHFIPPGLWNDYLRIFYGSANTEELLIQYGVHLVVVDLNRQPTLLRKLEETPQFTKIFSDAQAAAFLRAQQAASLSPSSERPTN